MPWSIEDYLPWIRGRESGGNDSARNPRSTASGRYQFTRDTWEGLGYDWRYRNDPNLQEQAVRTLTTQNVRSLQSAGIEINNANVYGAHFLGPSAARTVLRADNSTALTSLLSNEVIEANPFLRGMNVGAFRNWLSTRGRGGGSGFTGAEASTSTGGDTNASALGSIADFFTYNTQERILAIVLGVILLGVSVTIMLLNTKAGQAAVSTVTKVGKTAALAAI